MKFFVRLEPKSPKRQLFPYFEPPARMPVVKPENPDELKDGGVPWQNEGRPKKSPKGHVKNIQGGNFGDL